MLWPYTMSTRERSAAGSTNANLYSYRNSNLSRLYGRKKVESQNSL